MGTNTESVCCAEIDGVHKDMLEGKLTLWVL